MTASQWRRLPRARFLRPPLLAMPLTVLLHLQHGLCPLLARFPKRTPTSVPRR